MISVITTVRNEKELEILRKNLSRLESDWYLGISILAIAGQKDLYLSCREMLQRRYDENLVVYDENVDLKSTAKYLGDNPFIFVLDGGLIIQNNILENLYHSYIEKPRAGFISAFLNNKYMPYWVKDIYDEPKYACLEEKEITDDLTEVDIVPMNCFLTRDYIFKEMFCSDDLDDFGKYSFGIKLRRQGYINYINKKVNVRQEAE